jgi:hypothetical protein
LNIMENVEAIIPKVVKDALSIDLVEEKEGL